MRQSTRHGRCGAAKAHLQKFADRFVVRDDRRDRHAYRLCPLYVVSEEGLVVFEDDFLLDLLLWAGAILFAVGLMSLIMSGMTNRKQLSLAFVNEYEFYPEGLVINDYRAGEHVSTARLRYSDFEKIRESREFFLLYPNRVTVYPVDKALLTEEECAQLRAMLHLPAKPKKK